MYIKPVWQMIKEAVAELGGDAITNADIRKYILDLYGDVNEGTINDQIIICCVNRPSRVNFPENHKARIADGQYDFLYSTKRGVVVLYDPEKHGKWEITAIDGKPVVKQLDKDVEMTTPVQHHAYSYQKSDSRRIRPDIERPSPEAVKFYLHKWDTLENNKAQESALNKLFWNICPRNTSLDDVLIKVSTLNDFYSTNLYNVFAMAKHIVNLNIDERLERGDTSVVTDIASGHGLKHTKSGKEIQFFSFATKYCSHHRPLIFPIYDSYVEELLVYLKDIDGFASFSREGLHNIDVFLRTLNRLMKFYSLESFTLKDIDKYLWQYGKEKFPKVYERKQSE
jgi:hypothetical protein